MMYLQLTATYIEYGPTVPSHWVIFLNKLVNATQLPGNPAVGPNQLTLPTTTKLPGVALASSDGFTWSRVLSESGPGTGTGTGTSCGGDDIAVTIIFASEPGTGTGTDEQLLKFTPNSLHPWIFWRRIQTIILEDEDNILTMEYQDDEDRLRVIYEQNQTSLDVCLETYLYTVFCARRYSGDVFPTTYKVTATVAGFSSVNLCPQFNRVYTLFLMNKFCPRLSLFGTCVYGGASTAFRAIEIDCNKFCSLTGFMWNTAANGFALIHAFDFLSARVAQACSPTQIIYNVNDVNRATTQFIDLCRLSLFAVNGGCQTEQHGADILDLGPIGQGTAFGGQPTRWVRYRYDFSSHSPYSAFIHNKFSLDGFYVCGAGSVTAFQEITNGVLPNCPT
jgi:hypothetical protein